MRVEGDLAEMAKRERWVSQNRSSDLLMVAIRASRINHSATRDRRLRLATQDCSSRKATMGMGPGRDGEEGAVGQRAEREHHLIRIG